MFILDEKKIHVDFLKHLFNSIVYKDFKAHKNAFFYNGKSDMFFFLNTPIDFTFLKSNHNIHFKTVTLLN